MLEKIAEKINSEVFIMYDIACSLTSYSIVEMYAFDSLYLSLFVESWSTIHFGCYNHMSPNISLLWP